jgi:predicted HTH transcriptional regulator
MDLETLRRLAARGEGAALEFKHKANHPDKIARELVAFANASGGLLLLGVDDEGGIHGSKSPEEDQAAILLFAERYCRPRLPLRSERIPLSAKREVIAFHVKPGRQKPYFLHHPDPSVGKAAYYRLGHESITASRELIQLLRHERRSQGVRFSVGKEESRLLAHLEQHPHIDLDDTARLLGVSRARASSLLVLLVRAGLLNIHPSGSRDLYSAGIVS